MNSQIFIDDIKKLLVKNRNIILIITLAITISATLLSIFTSGSYQQTDQNTSTSILEEKPAIFKIYIEQKDGVIFTNSTILEEYLLLPKVVEDAEHKTNVEITDFLDNQIENNFVKTKTDVGVMGIIHDTNTHVFTFSVNLDNEEDSIAVAKYYYDFLVSGEVSILDNKMIYTLIEPQIIESEFYTPKEFEPEESGWAQNISGNTIITLLTSMVFGLLLSILIIFVKSYISKTINYSFNYSVSDKDNIIVLNEKKGEHLLKRIILMDTNFVIIFSEKSISAIKESLSQYNKIKVLDSTADKDDEFINILIVNSLDDLELGMTIHDPIILVETSSTTKKWYNSILNPLHNANIPVTVAQYEKKNI